MLPQFYVDDLIKTALTEDINYIDTTTDLMIPETARTKARFVAKADGRPAKQLGKQFFRIRLEV